MKDAALDVCIASGDDDVIIDMDTVEERMPLTLTDDFETLRKIVAYAKKRGAGYIHLY